MAVRRSKSTNKKVKKITNIAGKRKALLTAFVFAIVGSYLLGVSFAAKPGADSCANELPGVKLGNYYAWGEKGVYAQPGSTQQIGVEVTNARGCGKMDYKVTLTADDGLTLGTTTVDLTKNNQDFASGYEFVPVTVASDVASSKLKIRATATNIKSGASATDETDVVVYSSAGDTSKPYFNLFPDFPQLVGYAPSVRITDNYELSKVELYIDGQLIVSDSFEYELSKWSWSPNFAFSNKDIGEHTIRVVATDAAGNVSERSGQFTVSRK